MTQNNELQAFTSEVNAATVKELCTNWRMVALLPKNKKPFYSRTLESYTVSGINSEAELKAYLITRKEKAIVKQAAADASRIEAERSQLPVSKITISIEWKKSRTWGNNPNATAEVVYTNGRYESADGYRASGCGYAKESTVIAEVFNTYLKYALWQLGPEALKGGNGSGDTGKAPYGIHVYSDNRPYFGGGIGTNCYYAIAKYIGGEFKHVASGKTFDVYTITFPQQA